MMKIGKQSKNIRIRGQRPIYLVFQDGEVVGRFAGETPKDEFVQKVLNLIDVEEN